MALPVKTDIVTMDFGFRGSPFVSVEAKAAVVTAGMDWGYLGQPFVVNPSGGVAPTTSIKKYMGVAQASLKKANGVAEASIKKLMGVSNV